jgi:hypothetical protein
MHIALKEVEPLSLFFLSCLSVCALEGLKLNGIHQVLIDTNEDNLLVENQITMKKDTKSVTNKEYFLKVNTGKPNSMSHEKKEAKPQHKSFEK